MKILVISHMYPSTFNNVNGIFVHQQVKELINKGCEIKVISPVPCSPFPIKYLSKKWKRYSKIPKKSFWEEVEVCYPRYITFPKALFFSSSGKRMFNGIKNMVKEIHKSFKFDIIHSHVSLPDGWAGMEIAKKYKKPLFITVHGQDFQKTIFKNNKCKENIKKAISFANKLIVVSSKLKKMAEDNLKINSDRIIVIPNGINQKDIISRTGNKIVERYKNKKIILSVSHLIKTKGIDFNLKAIAKLKGKYEYLLYLIIGEGIERDNLETLSFNLGLENIVEFLGQVTHKNVMEYISICDIFSLPSWEEGFGIVYLEAMSQGKPVIACKDQGIADIVKDRETGLLVKPKDVSSLVNVIDYLLSNKENAKAIGDKAKKLVLENYTWEKNAQKTIEIYKGVISEN